MYQEMPTEHPHRPSGGIEANGPEPAPADCVIRCMKVYQTLQIAERLAPGSNTGGTRFTRNSLWFRWRGRWSLAALAGVLFCRVMLGGAATELPQQQDVLRATLSKGLRVIIVRNPLAPVVTTIINYRVGSDECPAGFPGTAHALEHMMFRGSPGLSADQLAGVTAAVGGDSNADTQQAVTQYFFTV